MAGGKASQKKIEILERQRRAIALRKSGASFRQIAVKISEEFKLEKYSEALAFNDVKAVLQRTVAETTLDVEEYIALEEDRLDAMLLSIASRVQTGDLQAIETALKIMRQRASLRGLNFADRIKVPETPTNNTPDGIELELITSHAERNGLNDREGESPVPSNGVLHGLS